MPANFAHLHVHSEYSLLDGLPKIESLVARVKELDMSSVALTDHGVMYGAVEFYKSCKKNDLKPLIGMEAYVVSGDHRAKNAQSDNHHLVLLAKNLTGYKNLMRLTTTAHLEGFHYRPRIGKDLLAKNCAGLICLSGCPKSELGQLLIAGNFSAARDAAAWYRETFGQDNYFLEIQRHQYRDYMDKVRDQPKLADKLKSLAAAEDAWVEGIIKISRELGIPIVATNDVHYLNTTDATAQDALVCISTGKKVSDIDRLRYVDIPTLHLRPPVEMAGLFADLPDAVKNTAKVAAACDVTIELGKWYFPNITIPTSNTAPDYLRELANDRLAQKFPSLTADLQSRLDFELGVIISKGYAPYFLMMADLVNWCTDHGIITNTRGSAAGSLVSFVLGITGIDPIRYQLPFERFLNPLRPKPPDIDLDVADDRREEVITYITNSYGQEKVAQICTFGRMLARAAVRDIGRVLGHPYAFPDRIAKLVPIGSQGFPMTVQKALDTSPELKILYDSDPSARQVLDLAREIEGNARHLSVHAAGIVVSPTAMTDYTPLQLEPNGTKIVTQYEMHACEDVGLVKFDILGIRHLSILGAARDIIESSRSTRLDLNTLPLDDKTTFASLARGETMGVFQLGGSGMTRWLKELRPNRLEDIMVMIALFRPGPMANIPEYIARKNKKSSVTYLHPKMARFLDKSYGILVYQEDVLFTALELAGYDWASVDALRQAIGKKKPKEMAQQHEIFVQGCMRHSQMSKDEAEKIWDLFVPFQGYGFNKAHAASYGLVSYQTAYLKAHYPVEYMTALLSAESGNTDKVVEAVDECRRMGVIVLAPDINTSSVGFTIEPHSESLDNRAVRFGLSAIKNVGEAAISAILAARHNGPFASLTDFCLRVDSLKVNRKVLESLIKAGALDGFGKRSALLAALDKVRSLGTTISRLKLSGQTSLFGDVEKADNSDHLPDIDEFEKTQKLGMEKDLLGFYLTEHPHAEKLAQLKSRTTHRLSDLYLEDLAGSIVTIGGLVESCRNVLTKNGSQPMCFAVLSDLGQSVEVVVFPRVYAATSAVWQPDNVILVSGKVEQQVAEVRQDNLDTPPQTQVTLIADSAAIFTGPDTVLPKINGGSKSGRQPAADTPPPDTSSVTIDIPASTPQSTLIKLNTLLQAHRGDTAASLIFHKNSSAKTLPLPFGLSWTPDLEKKIADLLRV